MTNFRGFFALLAVGAALLACTNELEEPNGKGNGKGKGKGESVVFTVGGVSGIETKAGVAKQSAVQTDKILISEPGDPVQLYLVETVQDMDSAYSESTGVDTKGTPVYTETFASTYHDFSALPYAGTELYKGVKSYQCGNLGGNRYGFDFAAPGWPKGTDFLFYMAAPANLEKASDETLGYSGLTMSEGKFAFDYTSPAAAENQKDLLFTSKPVTYDQYRAGTTILFYHTLAGVKFKSGNAVREAATETKAASKVQTNITKITLTEINSTGHCVVNADNSWSYSNSDSNAGASVKKSWDGTSVWTNVSSPSTFTADNLQLVHNEGQFAESTNFEGGKDLGQYNLNSATFDKTFMFVPQTTGDDVVLTVEYTLTVGGKESGTLKKSVMFNGRKWEAGKLYTYTLSANHVAVQVSDDIDKNNTKNSLVVTNTGNVDAYLRAAIVGNWYDTHGLQTNEYSESDRVYFQIVCPWGGMPTTIDESGNGENNEGKVTGLDNTNWIKGTDGFYYYKYIVKPGCDTKYKLFTTYKAKECPMRLYQGGKSHLELDIVVQAIDASKVGNMPAGVWETGNFTTAYDPE